jgi:hypothetical protein
MKFKYWLKILESRQIRGEYWITENGYAIQADDNSDYNHESYVIMQMQSDIASNFDIYYDENSSDWEELKELIVQKILKQHPEKNLYNSQYDPDEFIINHIKNDPKIKEKMNIANGSGDAREYAIINWGWKRVAGNYIESKSLTSEDMKQISNGLYEIDSGLDQNAKFHISIYGGKNYEVTLAELSAGKLYSDEHGFERARRQQQDMNKLRTTVAANQVRGLDLKSMNPHYQRKKYPFGD